MARHAEKKAQENAAFWSSILQNCLISLNVFYIVILCNSVFRKKLEWTWSMIFWPIIYAALEKKTYDMIISELSSGLTPNYSLDIFGVVTLSHLLSVFSDTLGGYVLYVIPLYIFYKVGGYALAYLKSKSDTATTAQEEPEEDPAEAKRKAKKERQEKRA